MANRREMRPRWSKLSHVSMRLQANIALSLLVSCPPVLITLSGCSPKTDRLEISGTVTLDGSPLDDGSIQFTSVGTKKVTASGAMVQNGTYEIPPLQGLTPGSYHVEINAPDTKAPPIMVRATPGGPGIETQPERIPAEYNVNSKQTVEVSADKKNHFEFVISSKAKK